MKPFVVIRWMDSQDHPTTWVDESDAEKFGEESCEVTSVGFLVRKTDKYYTLAGDWDPVDTNYGRVTKIPVSMAIEVTELKWPT